MIRTVKSLLLPALLMLAGCIPAPAQSPPIPDGTPVAFIDSVSATTVAEGQTVTFSGHGTDVGRTIVGYSWRSDRDGTLTTAPSFSTSSLSLGNHYIYFKVQNNSGDWSREVATIINILPVGIVKPSINSFKATPDVIFEGQSTTLTWSVSNALTVNIAPDIGNVSLTGSRSISPKNTTEYILTATNIAGSMTQTAKATIRQASGNFLELYSIPEEEGFADRNGEFGNIPRAGISGNGAPLQAFFSFDISKIPAGTVIRTASLDLTNNEMYGYPFGMLGSFGVFWDQYRVITGRSYVIAFTLDGLILMDTQPTEPYTSATLASALQKQLDAKSNRFQIRAQFAKVDYFIFNQGANYLQFGKGKTKLVVQY